ncbi:uncharacterized protein MYCGRDRAFT_106653 [Zymoseptoria tritici IPO323]|uniref:Uncharacterized protein n=1 Tax=Zymoseptoria tritici (strain CBS 115943 / IPO323) TaxID=336722 RepID=F9XRN1_ZYMTI|nr:uncharacterized protein MYCGRDRAFT_106653 [Zymoseptoria tritici IPO323]EGP82063.1 hypothetical protein MYCGRDRAFT_106653 [Zymoseptoria tritici IPO323]
MRSHGAGWAWAWAPPPPPPTGWERSNEQMVNTLKRDSRQGARVGRGAEGEEISP